MSTEAKYQHVTLCTKVLDKKLRIMLSLVQKRSSIW